MDFNIADYGTVWHIKAVSPEAIAFANDHFEVEGWQGVSEDFTTDHRAARRLVARLISEGWRVGA